MKKDKKYCPVCLRILVDSGAEWCSSCYADYSREHGKFGKDAIDLHREEVKDKND